MSSRSAGLFLLTLVTACGERPGADRRAPTGDSLRSVADTSTTDTSTTDITLYFTDAHELQVADCGAVLPAPRVVPDSLATPGHVLRLLLAGVTPAERAAGMSSQFHPTPGVGADRPLVDFLLGIEVSQGTAYLDFSPGALAYLNNAACLQGAVKQPMIRTLTTFPGIDRVRFRISGEIFEDWDA